MSSVITISQPPSVPGDKSINEARTEMTFAPMDLADYEADDLDIIANLDLPTMTSECEDDTLKKGHIDESLMKLESGRGRSSSRIDKKQLKDGEDQPSAKKVPSAQATITRRKRPNGPDAVIVLKEERVRSDDDPFVQ